MNFENRGCEAIVRSTVGVIRKSNPDAQFLVPSTDPSSDRMQWQDAEDLGVTFAPPFAPTLTRIWAHMQRRIPSRTLKSAGWPFPISPLQRRQIEEADLVLAIGGDNYSLDYKIPSPLMGIDGAAMDASVPVVLWGASVGPFEAIPSFVPKVRSHLARMTKILVRETHSEAYLCNTLGLENVGLMADPAFNLAAEPFDIEGIVPKGSNGLVGVNISPLLRRYSRQSAIYEEFAGFIRRLVDEGFGVLLVPHVGPISRVGKNDDHNFMKPLADAIGSRSGRVSLSPRGLNAAQLKFLIGQCRFFVGARTHSTIAALSSEVPTISLAYSVKAYGLNSDLFGDTKWVLHCRDASSKNLIAGFRGLASEETSLKARLRTRLAVARGMIDGAVRIALGAASDELIAGRSAAPAADPY